MSKDASAIASVLLIVCMDFAGCSNDSGSTATKTASAPMNSSSSEYPREVPISSIRDARIRNWATLSDPTVRTIVEVASGVYANRGKGALGSVDDYTSTFGLCADWNRFRREHPDVGGSCW
jgi:hypothetical protein